LSIRYQRDAVLLWTFTRLGDGPQTGSSLPLPHA
jgi:hypothetical protein